MSVGEATSLRKKKQKRIEKNQKPNPKFFFIFLILIGSIPKSNRIEIQKNQNKIKKNEENKKSWVFFITLKISLGIWWVGMRLFRLAWTAYFDDYTTFCRDVLTSNTTKTVEGLFTLLGVSFARDGDKAQSFSKKFKSLGVEIDVEGFRGGVVRIGHTRERQIELKAVLEDILQQGSVSAKQAESLRGRMHWFESFAFGRVANGAVKELGNLANRTERTVLLGPLEKKNLEFLMRRISDSKPLTITRSILRAWIVFTDGAVEGPEVDKVGSVGGVVFSPCGVCMKFFGGLIPREIMSKLLATSRNPIYEVEVIPIYIAAHLWAEDFKESQVVWYTDNEATRAAFIKAYGATKIADAFVSAFAKIEMCCQLKSWVARVPSASNPSDAPSRLDDSEMERLRATKVSIPWEVVSEIVQTVSSMGDVAAV